MKSLTRMRREQGAICAVCKSPDYRITEHELGPSFKPEITCNSCGHSWQYEYDGGIYAALEEKGEEK